jgi:hypothetical protein
MNLQTAKTYFVDQAQNIVDRLESDMTSVTDEEVLIIKKELMRLVGKLHYQHFDCISDLVIARNNQMAIGI